MLGLHVGIAPAAQHTQRGAATPVDSEAVWRDHERVKHYLPVPSIPREESTVSILEHTVTLMGSKEKARCRALFDSGAAYSIIRRDIAERVEPLVTLPDPENWIFETARPGDLIHASYRVTLNFAFDDSKARFSDEFIVFDECSEEVIVGAKTMQAWHITLDFHGDGQLQKDRHPPARVIAVFHACRRGSGRLMETRATGPQTPRCCAC